VGKSGKSFDHSAPCGRRCRPASKNRPTRPREGIWLSVNGTEKAEGGRPHGIDLERAGDHRGKLSQQCFGFARRRRPS